MSKIAIPERTAAQFNPNGWNHDLGDLPIVGEQVDNLRALMQELFGLDLPDPSEAFLGHLAADDCFGAVPIGTKGGGYEYALSVVGRIPEDIDYTIAGFAPDAVHRGDTRRMLPIIASFEELGRVRHYGLPWVEAVQKGLTDGHVVEGMGVLWEYFGTKLPIISEGSMPQPREFISPSGPHRMFLGAAGIMAAIAPLTAGHDFNNDHVFASNMTLHGVNDELEAYVNYALTTETSGKSQTRSVETFPFVMSNDSGLVKSLR